MKSVRPEQLPIGGADAALCALVLCSVPIVRAGIMHLIRARFSGELRVVGADGWGPRRVPVAVDQRFDIKIFHFASVRAADRLSRIAAAARDAVVIVVGPEGGPRQLALPAAVRWVALGAPLSEWCRVVRAALDDAQGRIPAPYGASVGRSRQPGRSTDLLTPRQLDVFNMLCLGHSNRAIAEEFGLSIGTVKLHVGAILQAMKAKRRVEIVLRRAGMQQSPGGRAVPGNHGQRSALWLDAPADDRLE